jgi:hypothetical protein
MSKKSSSRSRLFIGSSTESLDFAYAIQQNLEDDVEVTVWKQGVFELTKNTLEALTRALDRSDFGAFVFAPTDVVRLNQRKYFAVRDNVLFELGLFIGRLGRSRSFIVCPKGHHSLRIPTDLTGITVGLFDPKRKDGNLEAAFGPFCHQVRKQIRRLGTRKPRKQRVLTRGRDRLASENGPLASTVSVPSTAPHQRVESVVLERPRVPFLGGQGADFHLKELPSGCPGFRLGLGLPRQPYWRVGFVLAPEDYIREGRSDIEITKYFLFHAGRGDGKNPTEGTELRYQAYYNSGPLIGPTAFGFEPSEGVLNLDVAFTGGTDVRVAAASGSVGFGFSTVVDRSYIRYLYLLAWADRLAPFRVPITLDIR